MELFCGARRVSFLRHWALVRPRFIYFSSKQPRTFNRRSSWVHPLTKPVSWIFKRLSNVLLTLYCFIVLRLWANCPFKSHPAHPSGTQPQSTSSRRWKTCQKCSAAELSDPPCCLHGSFLSFLCVFFVSLACSVTLFLQLYLPLPSSFASFLPHFPSFTTCSLLFLPLPFHLSIPIYYLSINNGPCCCCWQPDAAAAFVAALLSCILTHLLLPVL